MKTATLDHEEVTRQTGVAGVRPGTEADALLGLVPALVALPAGAEEVARLLAWASREGLAVAPCGARTKLDRGARPVAVDLLLDLSRLSALVDHVAGDLTVTVQAGMRLDHLQRALAPAGQFLALDPVVPGTIGGLIATNDSGPRRVRYGGVRDQLLGITYVRADGGIASAGGRVVKNVAGYDLCKLFAGSLGTLGVVVQATFRLYPLPSSSATVLRVALSPLDAGRLALAVLNSGVVPTSLDYFSEGSDAGTMAVRFESSPRSVEAQVSRAAGLMGHSAEVLAPEAEASAWARFDGIAATTSRDVLVKLASTITGTPQLLESAARGAERAGVALSVRAHLGHGHALLRWHEPDDEQAIALLSAARHEAESAGSSLVVWRAPQEVRDAAGEWGSAGEGLDLMRRVKAQFDPGNTLNPGRYIAGI